MKIKLTNANDSVVIEKSNGTSSEVATKADISAITKSDIGLGNVGNFKAVSTEAEQGLTANEKSNARTNIGVPELNGGDDAARVNWGGDWRMPTVAEFQALSAAVNTAWTDDYQSSGIAGLVCTDKTDSSKVLFFPAAGGARRGSVEDVGIAGYYWSSSRFTISSSSAYGLYFKSNDVGFYSDDLRCYGFTVRPVLDGTNANGHDYVEIGGIKWATMNIGASSISDYGLYFAWGDTQGYTASQVGSGEGQKYFGWADYKYGNGTSSPSATGMTKYNATDGKTVLELSTPVEYLHKVAVTGDYNDLSNKPNAVQIQADWKQTNTSALDYIKNKPIIPDAQVHADWAETDSSKISYIENKPTLNDTIRELSTEGILPVVFSYLWDTTTTVKEKIKSSEGTHYSTSTLNTVIKNAADIHLTNILNHSYIKIYDEDTDHYYWLTIQTSKFYLNASRYSVIEYKLSGAITISSNTITILNSDDSVSYNEYFIQMVGNNISFYRNLTPIYTYDSSTSTLNITQ